MHLLADFADQLTFTTAHFSSDTQTTFSKAINNLCAQKSKEPSRKKTSMLSILLPTVL